MIIVIAVLIAMVSSCKKDDNNDNDTIYIYDYEELLSYNIPVVNYSKGEYDEIIIYKPNAVMIGEFNTAMDHATDTEDSCELSKLSISTGILENMNAENHDEHDGMCYSTDDKGNIYIVKYNYDSENPIYAIRKYDREMNYLSEVELDVKEDSINFTSLTVYNDFYILSSFNNNSLKIFDNTGILVDETAIGTSFDYNYSDQYAVMSNKLYIIAPDGYAFGKLVVYDMEKLQIMDEKKIDEPLSFPPVIYANQNTKKIYMKNESIIKCYDEDFGYLRDILDLREYNVKIEQLSESQNYLSARSIIVDDDENVYIFYKYINSVKLIKFRLLEHEKAKEEMMRREEEDKAKTKIKFYIKNIRSGISDLIAEYEKINKNVKIEVIGANDGLGWVDYTQYINLNLIYGNTEWDILDVSSLPFDIYSNKGYLEDLTLLDENGVFADSEKYYTNIFEAVKKGESIYYFPISFSITVAFTDDDSFPGTFAEFRDLCYGYMNQNKFPFDFPNSMFSNYPEGMISTVLSLYRDYYIKENGTKIDFKKENFIEIVNLAYDLYKNYLVMEQDGKLILSAGVLIEKYKKNIFPIISSGGINKFVPQQMMAINKKSQVKQEAFDFLVYWSQHSQVNSVYKKGNQYPNSQIDFNTKDEIFGKLNTVNALNFYLNLPVYDLVTDYCKGDIDFDAMVKLVEEKFRIYSDEG